MAESGNSEAKKILGNLNSMSQEDLDSKLSTLFGKGGASKEGDTAPKDEKGGKAPEGKEEAPKGEKGAKEGKVKDEPRDLDDDYKELRHKDGVIKQTRQALKQAREQSANNPQRLKELDETDKKLDDYISEPLGQQAPKEMKSAKDGIKPVEIAPTQNTDAFGTSKEMGGGIGGGQKDLLGKKADLANPNRPDIQAEMEQEMEDQLSGTGTDFEDAEGLAQAFDVVKERYKNDPQRLAVVNKLEGKEKFRAAAKEYLEKNSGTSPLWAKAGMTGNQKQLDAKATYDAMFDFISDASTIEEAFAEARLYRDGENDKEFLDYLEQRVLGKDNKGSASNPMTSATEGIKPVESGKPKGSANTPELKQQQIESANKVIDGFNKQNPDKSLKNNKDMILGLINDFGFTVEEAIEDALKFMEEPSEKAKYGQDIKQLIELKNYIGKNYVAGEAASQSKGFIDSVLQGEDATWLYNNFSEQMSDEGKEANKSNLMDYLEDQISAFKDEVSKNPDNKRYAKDLGNYEKLLKTLQATPDKPIRATGKTSLNLLGNTKPVKTKN
jgi:hypothetical protein